MEEAGGANAGACLHAAQPRECQSSGELCTCPEEGNGGADMWMMVMDIIGDGEDVEELLMRKVRETLLLMKKTAMTTVRII